MKGVYFKIIGFLIVLFGVIGGIYFGIITHSFLSFFGIMIGSVIEAMLFFGIGAILDKLDSYEPYDNSSSNVWRNKRLSDNRSAGAQPITPSSVLMKHISGLDLQQNETVKVYVSEERIALVKDSYTKIIRIEDIVAVASGLKKQMNDVDGFDKNTLDDSLFYLIIKYGNENDCIVLDVNGNRTLSNSFRERFYSNQMN